MNRTTTPPPPGPVFTRFADPKSYMDIASLLELPKGSKILVFAPHPDDAELCGIWWHLLAEAGYDVTVCNISDGRMGYWEPSQRKSIVGVRRKECTKACRLLGVQHLSFLNFPDCDLTRFRGRRRANLWDYLVNRRMIEAGSIGMQNSITAMIRRAKPTAVFFPTAADLHRDHQVVVQEILISLFHASGKIWGELGSPWDVSRVFEFPVYCNPNSFTHQVEMTERQFALYLEVISCFASQPQIGKLVNSRRDGGPFAHLNELNLPERFYTARNVAEEFARALTQ